MKLGWVLVVDIWHNWSWERWNICIKPISVEESSNAHHKFIVVDDWSRNHGPVEVNTVNTGLSSCSCNVVVNLWCDLIVQSTLNGRCNLVMDCSSENTLEEGYKLDEIATMESVFNAKIWNGDA